ncbi:TIGR04290 family methyltransferase [Inquilinus sp. CAU 1745]|uniref:TIGR04290 family methyltransferase n=1 Tax=Inquilinus sp. CAU 1745 TaxID=3140369 RepID=UPI00325C3361
MDTERLGEQVAALGPWFHNLHLPGGVETAPGHRFGDFPAFKWRQICDELPEDMRGMRALDIGCNAGFYSFAMAQRGAEVLGIDFDARYLRQARWAAEILDIGNVTFEQRSVYQLADLPGRFDVILFMGVLYHLRYPLLALDMLSSLRPGLLIFQTLTFGEDDGPHEPEAPADFDSRDRLARPDWPHLAFIETTFADDPTNWWAPNAAAAEAMLRSAGFRVLSRPAHEFYVCVPAEGGLPAQAGASLDEALPAACRLRKIEEFQE